jgi:hypothetical protein
MDVVTASQDRFQNCPTTNGICVCEQANQGYMSGDIPHQVVTLAAEVRGASESFRDRSTKSHRPGADDPTRAGCARSNQPVVERIVDQKAQAGGRKASQGKDTQVDCHM